MQSTTGTKVVSYFHDDESGIYMYNPAHPWRPHRSTLVHSLVQGYDLEDKMVVHRPRARTYEELTMFHADDYISFIRAATPNHSAEYMQQLKRFNMGAPGESDCPVFDGMYEYFSLLSGGSVDGAALLASGKADIAFNWAGGMHHAKKAEASGFCYINDIVLAILELLKTYKRVLYVDIDIHHGDGVEEAFYLTDRVMTVSFHKYGDYFPGTGSINDVGYQKGKLYTVNVPLGDGMDDDAYRFVYEPIMKEVMARYQPEAIVVCSGADSLSGDKLGCFNLSIQGHSHCVEFLEKYNVPLLVVGGGGYTLRNVARCWAYETGALMGIDLPDELPESTLKEFNYFMDTQRLRIAVSNMENANTPAELQKIVEQVIRNLQQLPPVPSVGIQDQPPPDKVPDLPEEEMDAKGGGQAHQDARIVKAGDEDVDDDKQASAHRKGFKGDITPPPGARSPAAAAVKEEEGGGGGGEAAAAPMQVDGGGGAAAAPAAPAGGKAAGVEPSLEADEKLDTLSPPPEAAPAPAAAEAAGAPAAAAAGGGSAAAAPASNGGAAEAAGGDAAAQQ